MPDDSFVYYDLQRKRSGHDIALFFSGWQPGSERLAVLSPHDDDAILGAGYLIQAAQANGGEVYLLILCDGGAGYSTTEEKDTITEVRKAESLAAYQALDLDRRHILWFDYPDFGLIGHLGLCLPDGSPGTMRRMLPELRRLRITRLLIPNGYREHIDHEATARIGRYDGPQVGDPVLVDLGIASPVQSTLQYAVWGDFSPEDALAHGRPMALRANRALLATSEAEAKVMKGLRAYRSQARIIEALVAAREARHRDGRWLEVYMDLDPRPALTYGPYHTVIQEIDHAHQR